MSIEPAPNRDDRLTRTHKASIIDTYIAESSVTAGDDAMTEVALYRNNASEQWLSSPWPKSISVSLTL